MLELMIEDARKRAVTTLFTDQVKEIPEFQFGEAVPLSVALLEAIASPTTSRLYEARDLTGYSFRAAIGKGFLAPVAGVFTLTFTAEDLSEETTDELPFNATASQIEDALNAGAKMTAAGGVTVTGSAGFFYVTFNDEGVRHQLEGDGSNLAPLSLVTAGTLIDGSVDLQEVQTIRIMQNPGSLCELDVNSDAGSATWEELQVGSGATNHKGRVTFSPVPFDGSWTFTVKGVETDFIDFDASAADVQSAIEALAGVGEGNVSVVREAAGQYLVMFIGDLANTAIEGITVDGTGLKTVMSKSGTLDLRVPGIDLLLGGESSVQVVFEIEAVPPGGSPKKIFRQEITLLDAIILPDSLVTQPSEEFFNTTETQDLIEAYSGSSVDLVVDSTAETTLQPTRRFAQWFQKVTANAGGGAYTHKLVLDTGNPVTGAVYRIAIDIVASVNPTIEIRNATGGGTLLDTVVGDAVDAQYYVFEGFYDGAEWKKISGAFL